MAFTTWDALKTTILDDISTGAWKTKRYALAGGIEHTYQDLAEIQKFLEYCDSQISAASGAGVARAKFVRPL